MREPLAKAADETRRFRHRAAHNYNFQLLEVTRTIEAAKVLADGLAAEIRAFRNIIDPPDDELERGGDGA